MNVDELTKVIRTALDAAALTRIPVTPPGTPISVIPAVVLAPSDDDMEDGNRTLRHGIDITLLVPRGKQTSQYGLLTQLQHVILRSLVPIPVRFEGPQTFTASGGGDTGEPAALARIIPITFVSDVDLCP